MKRDVAFRVVLRRGDWAGKLDPVDEGQGIYRGEVLAIMGALADIGSDTQQILGILGGYDAEDDEPEEMDT
ncbi:MAG: hypothetical protein ABR521_14115 [Gaiellaceae bacterium]